MATTPLVYRQVSRPDPRITVNTLSTLFAAYAAVRNVEEFPYVSSFSIITQINIVDIGPYVVLLESAMSGLETMNAGVCSQNHIMLAYS
ncbi:hypothetical protein NL676_014128 [Syzygium grande]|nr:hypothetical protein NL676_014128 [Syzygium grande]